MTVRGLERGQRAAMLISECQRGMVDPAMAINPALAAQAHDRDLPARIAALAEECRAVGVPVVHCTYVPPTDFVGYVVNNAVNALVRRDGRLQPGTVYTEIHPALRPRPEDSVVERSHGLSLFHGTAVEDLLRQRGVATVILTGVSTNLALFGTALEAVNRGYQVVLPEDCTAGATAETHAFHIRESFPLLAAVTDAQTLVTALRVRQAS